MPPTLRRRAPAAAAHPPGARDSHEVRGTIHRPGSGVLLLVRAARPQQALLTAGGLAVAAALSRRSGHEVLLVLVTVLVGQAVLGWHRDLLDTSTITQRRLDPATTWFALACGVLLVIPLAVQNGVWAGAAYLASLAVGLAGDSVLRRGRLSWLPWAVAFGLYPFFLSYGGWGGTATGAAPSWSMVALAALLGVGAHVLCALPGLVADHQSGHQNLPLVLARQVSAPRLRVLALTWIGVDILALLVVGASVGLRR